LVCPTNRQSTNLLFLENLVLKTLVLGMGNTILCDDGVGIYVVQEVAKQFQRDGVDFAEASVGGMRLLDVLKGYERVIMVDAIQTRDGKPGDVYRIGPDDLKVSLHAGSTHDLSLPGALALGRGMGMTLPDDEDFVIVAVEVEDVLTFGEECTPVVEEAIPQAVEAVLAELEVRES
jgi:hydrogenase maturation protease